MLQAYPHLSGVKQVDGLFIPDFYLYVHCMYNFIAMGQGVDPENPPKSVNDTTIEEKPAIRKLGGSQAAAELQKLSLLKEKASSTEE